ncbi:MAG: hypothetical protein KDK91_19495, partial [Gammaproteobacteria bacterium]|nr:hypothetical protein [Gammaproteobacteria bacterium]
MSPANAPLGTGPDAGPAYAQSLLRRVATEVAAVEQTLNRYGKSSLREYLGLFCDRGAQALQCREDFFEVVERLTQRALGNEVAARALADLRESPVVLTANHHGLDTFAQQFQQSLLFSRRRLPSGRLVHGSLVLACATVPLNNLTYPRGILLYGHRDEKAAPGPLKLPLFSDRTKHDAVCFAAPIDAAMLERASNRLQGWQ